MLLILLCSCAFQVFNLVTPKDKKFSLFEHQVCMKGLAKLLGVGSGRLYKMRAAARDGQDCPMDKRLRTGQCSLRWSQQSYKRQLIFDYLQELYQKHSEPVPEVNASNDRRQTVSRHKKGSLQIAFRKRKGKRPRVFFKRDKELTPEGAQKLRQLPASSYADWLRLFEAKNPQCKVSYKLFTRAPCQNAVLLGC